jgi:Domain of unknown function (DUF1906)
LIGLRVKEADQSVTITATLLGLKPSKVSAGLHSRRVRVVGLLAVLATALVGASPAHANAASKVVRYRGYSLTVPASWPVFALAARPTTCVRFDRHAVYLGRPSSQQRCPTAAAGRTEAILVEPSTARGASLPAILPGAQRSAAEVSAANHRVLVLGTWASDPGVVERALRLPSLRALRAHSVRAPAAHAARARATVAGTYTGLGFDACSAPSAATMSAWASSPYHAVGIYIGGDNVACSQPNLSPEWVSQETAAGWHLIPTYVGLQAGGACGGCATISSRSAASEGSAAAGDAATEAGALGIAPGNPIYYDMEGYAPGSSTTPLVLKFLSAWTQELHALGYTSGVYSSGDSGIRDLADAEGTTFVEPDDIWIARWNGEQNTADPSVPSTDWPNRQRIHQYAGGHNATYGGYTLNIDSNYLNGATAGGSCYGQLLDGTFVAVDGTAAVYRMAGGAPLFVSDWSTVGGAQPVTPLTAEQFDSLCPVPINGTFLVSSTGAIYRVAGGAPLSIPSWSLFGAVQPYISIDQWDLNNLGNPAAHLNAVPASGTLVEGLPSHKFWTFSRGRRIFSAPRGGAVVVADAGLRPFATVPCVVPRLTNLTFPQAKSALAKADCRLGKVGRPRHWPRFHKLRVYWQIPVGGRRHAAGWLVGIKMK